LASGKALMMIPRVISNSNLKAKENYPIAVSGRKFETKIASLPQIKLSTAVLYLSFTTLVEQGFDTLVIQARMTGQTDLAKSAGGNSMFTAFRDGGPESA
jgi:hypothetical protein